MRKDEAKDSKKIAMNFWGRVELAQNEAGFDTIKDLCQEAGVVYQTVMNQRSSGTLPNLMTILKISRHVQKSMDWLLMGYDNPTDLSKQKVAQAILNDQKAYDIARYVLSMPEEEKEATMVILKKVSDASNKKKS
jgi:hypothetical protein